MMITVITLGAILAAILGVVGVVLLLVGVPMMVLFGLLPWFLNVAAVVLLVKALLDRPFEWRNFMPAATALLLSCVLRWIF